MTLFVHNTDKIDVCTKCGSKELSKLDNGKGMVICRNCNAHHYEGKWFTALEWESYVNYGFEAKSIFIKIKAIKWDKAYCACLINGRELPVEIDKASLDKFNLREGQVFELVLEENGQVTEDHIKVQVSHG